MGRSLTNEEFLNKLKEKNIKYKPLENYNGSHKKMKWQCYKNENHIFEMDACNIYNNRNHCPYCKNRKVFKGENDMWTTNPKLCDMLLNPNDGYKYSSNGSQSIDWVCPNCGNVINKRINQVRLFGLNCDKCSDGISYSEKFIMSLLKQLQINYIHDKSVIWSNKKRYDFYIESLSLIIECNGIQHYESSFYNGIKTRTVEQEINNDLYKKDLALTNGIKYYVELDCKYSNLKYIKNSILNSELNNIFDLSNINWEKCNIDTLKNNTRLICDLWNSGIKDTNKISKITGIHISSVISKLKQGVELGLCDYFTNCKKCKKVLCIETGKIYNKIIDVKNDGYSNVTVGRCCNNITKTSGGKHWMFI